MKRHVILLMIIAAMLTGCKKEGGPKNNRVIVMNEKVTDIDPTRVEISGAYSYPSDLDGIYVLVSGSSDMADASAFESVLSGKSFTADVTGLKENTKYYYRYRFVSMGTEQESEAVRSFTTATYGVPVVITAEVTNITATTATCGGEVTDDGYLEVTARGVCWGTSPNPTVNDSHTTDGGGTGVFTSTTSNLEPGESYYIRAYATNSRGTGYGETKEFTTLDGDSDIYTGTISGITPTSAVCDGSKVTDGGGLDVMDKGLCWAKHPNPTTADAKVSKGAGLGEFTVEMAGLEVGERYYVRAYSVNTKETKYGNEREFTTMNGIPAVTTSSVTNIMATTATCGGEVTGDGGLPVTERGVCWSKTANPTVSDSHKQSGSGTGSFTVNLDNLEVDETYHVRSYAKNSHTTSYGDDVVFSTKDGIPAVTTSSVTNIMATTATCGGKVTDDGGFPVTERGVCWSKSTNPTVEGSHKTGGSGNGSFTVGIDNLEMDETYHVRSYAKNSHTTSYGNDVVFSTKDGTPVVTTSSVTNVMATTATCGGEVTEDYGFSVTARGVCWSTSPNPTVSDSHTTDGSGTGSFTSSITGLTANTTYYVRAYATNSAGTSYGEQRSFTTLSGDYVDLGLPSGLLWATCNVGAEHPYDYGWYFMWGSVTEGGDPDCSWANCPGNGGSSDYNADAFSTWKAANLTNNVLNSGVDAATANWGGGWRMPTPGDWQELYNNTTSTWATENGVAGRKFTSKADSSKYIFLPAAGYRDGTSLKDAGSYGRYWSNSLFNSFSAYDMCLYLADANMWGSYLRYRGLTVRPVR